MSKKLTIEDKRVYELLEKAAGGDTRPFIETMLRIQDKSGKLVPFHFNAIQNDYWDKRTGNDIILKPRQVGFTTLVQGEFLADALVIPGIEILYTAQRDDSAKRLFEITQRMFHNLPEGLRPEVISDSTHMLQIKQGNQVSTIEIGTAGSSSFGRGRPVQRALFSEVAFYEANEESTMAGIIAAMPIHEQIGARVVKESTANGMAGVFYEDWKSAVAKTSSDTAHFYPWFFVPEYNIQTKLTPNDFTPDEVALIGMALQGYGIAVTPKQIAWRRHMEGSLDSPAMFLQEFPETPEDSFRSVGGTVFNQSLVNRVSSQGVSPPIHYVDSIPGTDDGYMAYWEYVNPGVHYVIAVDQSSGDQVDKDHNPTDYQVATIWDAVLHKQVGTLRGHINQQLFSDLVAKLHKYFNNALVVPERNLAQYGWMDLLRNSGCSNIYFHYADKKFGYPVNGATKNILEDNMRDLMKGASILVRSDNIISELRTFLNLKSGSNNIRRTGAPPGAHDDELITAMLANSPSVIHQAMQTYLPVTIDSSSRPTTYTTVGATI